MKHFSKEDNEDMLFYILMTDGKFTNNFYTHINAISTDKICVHRKMKKMHKIHQVFRCQQKAKPVPSRFVSIWSPPSNYLGVCEFEVYSGDLYEDYDSLSLK